MTTIGIKNKVNRSITMGALFLVIFLNAEAQERTHRGFYLSSAIGPVFGVVNASDNQGHYLKIEGTGFALDIQVGGAIRENIILHGVLEVKSLVNPSVNGTQISGDVSISETLIGIGATRYFSGNLFMTGNIGLGDFSIDDKSSSVSTDTGFSFQVKAGKEWWVSKKIGLGLVFFYGRTNLTSSPGGGIHETWNSNRYGVMFSFSFAANGSSR